MSRLKALTLAILVTGCATSPNTIPAPDTNSGTQGTTGLQGPQGLPGAKGDTGQQGLPGTPGLKGEPGFQGLQGLPGPKGDTGLQGPQGNQGAMGPKGPVQIKSSARMKSQIWITDDGAEGPGPFFDTGFNQECKPEFTTTGYRCLPKHIELSSTQYLTGSNCTQRVIVAAACESFVWGVDLATNSCQPRIAQIQAFATPTKVTTYQTLDANGVCTPPVAISSDMRILIGSEPTSLETFQLFNKKDL